MSKSAARTAEPARRTAEDLAAEMASPQWRIASCPPWCTSGPHEDAYLRAWHEGEAAIVHEAYLLREENAEVVLEQFVHVSSSGETDRPMPPSLYVHIEGEIVSAETADGLATALCAAARLVQQLANA